MRIRVTAPATTANLGPGFDCLGAAVALHLEVAVSPADGGRTTATGVYRGPGEPEDLPPPTLIERAIALVVPDAGPLAFQITSHIPLGRGLGSSASAVAAGLLIGCAMAGRDPDPDELLRLGTPLEGHPDNLAPALFGGLVLVVGGVGAMRFAPTPAIRPAVVVPRERLSTAEARKALPDRVSLADAVANVARSSGLVALLTGSAEPTADALLGCTQDLLHQPYRAPLMQGTADVIAQLRQAGIPAFVSGAGPSVGCLLVEGLDEPLRSVTSGLSGWSALELDWDLGGASVVG